jgi:death-on-curing protein
VIHLTLEELLRVAERALGEPAQVRDVGLLEAALARPKAAVDGTDAYPGLHQKAAALAHSIARNRALVDGNRRLALAALIAFLGVNGQRVTFSRAGAYDFIVDVATGQLDDVRATAAVLRHHTEPR